MTKELTIDDTRSFQYVQYEFTGRYPFLKIDFLRPFSGDKIPFFIRQKAPGAINIGKYRTVAEVVRDFEAVFGLSMIVLRRAGNVWIGTSLTADWTLEQQNREGEHISRISGYT